MDNAPEDYIEHRQQETDIGLYQAMWSLDRLMKNKTFFLLERLHGVDWVRLPVKIQQPLELPIWHHVAMAIRENGYDANDFLFTGCGLLVHHHVVPDIDAFRRLAAITSRASLRGLVSNDVIVHRYATAEEQSGNPAETVMYRTVDRLRPWVVSTLPSGTA
jgi:hypothetical protein